MSENHLRKLLEDAVSDVPAPHMTTGVVKGVRRRRIRTRITAGAAAVIVATAGIGLAGPMLDRSQGNDSPVAERTTYEPAERAPVSDVFECPHTQVVVPEYAHWEFTDKYNPDFGVGKLGAKRFEVIEVAPQRRTVQVGDSQGNLTARIDIRAVNGPTDTLSESETGWVYAGSEHCTGPNSAEVPTANRFRLGAHGRPIPVPPVEGFITTAQSAVLPVDDRRVYNSMGLVQHQTIYAYEVDDQSPTHGSPGLSLQLSVFAGDSESTMTMAPGTYPEDVLGPDFVSANDPMVGGDEPYALWTYYTLGDAQLVGHLQDGQEVRAEAFRADDWQGTLYIVFAPAADLMHVTLEEDGKVKTMKNRRR